MVAMVMHALLYVLELVQTLVRARAAPAEPIARVTLAFRSFGTGRRPFFKATALGL
jgi:hypothetical protein